MVYDQVISWPSFSEGRHTEGFESFFISEIAWDQAVSFVNPTISITDGLSRKWGIYSTDRVAC